MWVEPQATALASTWGEHRRVCDLSVTLPALTQERMTLRMLVIEGSPSEDQRHIGDDRVAYGLLPASAPEPPKRQWNCRQGHQVWDAHPSLGEAMDTLGRPPVTWACLARCSQSASSGNGQRRSILVVIPTTSPRHNESAPPTSPRSPTGRHRATARRCGGANLGRAKERDGGAHRLSAIDPRKLVSGTSRCSAGRARDLSALALRELRSPPDPHRPSTRPARLVGAGGGR
jgi:hypothetical protein